MPFTVAAPLEVGSSGEKLVPPDMGLMYCVSPGRGPGPCLVLPRDRLLHRKIASATNAARTATPAIDPPTMAPVRLTLPLLAPVVDGASVPVGKEVDEDDVSDAFVVVVDDPVIESELVAFEVWWVDVLGDEMVSVVVRDPDVVVLVSEVGAVEDSFEADTVSVLAVKDTVTLSSVRPEVRPVALLATVVARSLAVPQPY